MTSSEDIHQVAGWNNKSMIKCSSKPKSIFKCASLNSLCSTQEPLWTYKWFTRVYGHTKDEDFSNTKHMTISNLQKMINLYNMWLCWNHSKEMADILQ